MGILYVDYNASTPVDPRVVAKMHSWFSAEPGNAGSHNHDYGLRAARAVERARAEVAAVIDANLDEIYFTGGATESNNLATLGLRHLGEQTGRRHIVSSVIEHPSVSEPLAQLRVSGFEVDFLPVSAAGYVDPNDVKRKLRSDTLLVSVMHANNETGVLQPVRQIGEQLLDSPVLFHVDAAQTYGKEVEKLKRVHCDLLSLSGHKIYGPKGVGALYVRRRRGQPRAVSPLMYGGGQERGMRPGSLPVPLIVGLGTAARLAVAEYRARRDHDARVKRQFLDELGKTNFVINGDAQRTQPHVVNLQFPGVDSHALMYALRSDIAISTGSSCTSSEPSPSHVLQAMGLDEQQIESSVRLSWGIFVDRIPTERLLHVVAELRETC